MKVRVFDIIVDLLPTGWRCDSSSLLNKELNRGFSVEVSPGDSRYYRGPQDVALRKLDDAGIAYIILEDDRAEGIEGRVY